VTPCGGERRFASSAAKRLQSLGALLKGDRRALGAGAELKSFDIDNKYGKEALRAVYGYILGEAGHSSPLQGVRLPTNTDAAVAAEDDEDEIDADEDMHDEQSFRHRAQRMLESVGLASSDTNRWGSSSFDVDSKLRGKVDKFLNRLLGLKLSEQQQLFDFFSSTFDAVGE
jgi:hypothetical protein